MRHCKCNDDDMMTECWQNKIEYNTGNSIKNIVMMRFEMFRWLCVRLKRPLCEKRSLNLLFMDRGFICGNTEDDQVWFIIKTHLKSSRSNSESNIKKKQYSEHAPLNLNFKWLKQRWFPLFHFRFLLLFCFCELQTIKWA